jgi:hypothetical protein
VRRSTTGDDLQDLARRQAIATRHNIATDDDDGVDGEEEKDEKQDSSRVVLACLEAVPSRADNFSGRPALG